MKEPRIPEVGQSPLLNRKVVDKPITDPIFNQAPQPQPQPQQTQQAPPQQPQQPQQPFLEGDASTEHLSQPQTPLDDPNLREMTFDSMGMGEEGAAGEGGGSGEGGGESMSFQLPKGAAKEFAKTMVNIGSLYVPMFLAKIATINVNELEIAESNGKVPPGSAQLFRNINAKTEAGLKITDEEQEMIQNALRAYLEWKQIAAANPGTALAIALGVLGFRLTLTTFQSMRENRAMYKQFLEEYATPAAQPMTTEPTKKDK